MKRGVLNLNSNHLINSVGFIRLLQAIKTSTSESYDLNFKEHTKYQQIFEIFFLLYIMKKENKFWLLLENRNENRTKQTIFVSIKYESLLYLNMPFNKISYVVVHFRICIRNFDNFLYTICFLLSHCNFYT